MREEDRIGGNGTETQKRRRIREGGGGDTRDSTLEYIMKGDSEDWLSDFNEDGLFQ